jgi:hypothetical protein
MTETDVKRPTWERKILRRVHGPVVEQGIWRVRTEQELRQLYKDSDIVADLKKKLKWIRHVVRMDQRRRVKKISESKPEGSRKRGRPRLRWLEHVEVVTVGSSRWGRMGGHD